MSQFPSTLRDNRHGSYGEVEVCSKSSLVTDPADGHFREHVRVLRRIDVEERKYRRLPVRQQRLLARC